jgi:Na+/H+-dicarboxylate symporter
MSLALWDLFADPVIFFYLVLGVGSLEAVDNST